MGGRMRIASVLLVVGFLVAVAPGSAAAADCTTGGIAESDVEAFVDGYNNSTDRLPGMLRDRLANERIVVDVTGVNATYTLVTNGGATVTTIESGSVNPTLRVTTSASVLCDATASDDPAGAMLDAYNRGSVEVDGVGMMRSVGVTAAEAAYGIGRTLGFW